MRRIHYLYPIGMPGDELLRWAAYSHPVKTAKYGSTRRSNPDQQAAFALRFVEGNCIRLQRKVDRISNSSSIVLLFAARTLKFIDEEFENEWHRQAWKQSFANCP